MTNYENEIMNLLKGDTPKQKHDSLCEIFKLLIQNNEMFNEFAGVYSKQ